MQKDAPIGVQKMRHDKMTLHRVMVRELHIPRYPITFKVPTIWAPHILFYMEMNDEQMMGRIP